MAYHGFGVQLVRAGLGMRVEVATWLILVLERLTASSDRAPVSVVCMILVLGGIGRVVASSGIVAHVL